MDLNSKQKEVDDWIQQYRGYWPPLSMFARLVEETGELGRELNHVYGMKKRKEGEKIKEIEDEIGDILLTLIMISNSLKIDLEKVFDKTMNKIKARDRDRTKTV
jgi:NTP pyrophosphatase (non-canonical NTP hydrolase)